MDDREQGTAIFSGRLFHQEAGMRRRILRGYRSKGTWPEVLVAPAPLSSPSAPPGRVINAEVSSPTLVLGRLGRRARTAVSAVRRGVTGGRLLPGSDRRFLAAPTRSEENLAVAVLGLAFVIVFIFFVCIAKWGGY